MLPLLMSIQLQSSVSSASRKYRPSVHSACLVVATTAYPLKGKSGLFLCTLYFSFFLSFFLFLHDSVMSMINMDVSSSNKLVLIVNYDTTQILLRITPMLIPPLKEVL